MYMELVYEAGCSIYWVMSCIYYTYMCLKSSPEVFEHRPLPLPLLSMQLWRRKFVDLALVWMDVLAKQINQWVLQAVASDQVRRASGPGLLGSSSCIAGMRLVMCT